MLDVADCVREDDCVWLGVEVWLLVLESVCDCEEDPVALAVSDWLWVIDGVDEADGVSTWLDVEV